MSKPKAYMICTHTDAIASSMDSAPNIGVEFMGNCSGEIVDESGKVLGRHFSSSFGWLRLDLASKVSHADYDIVDLIGKEIPESLKGKLGP